MDSSEYLGSQLSTAYQNLYKAQKELSSSPMTQASNYLATVVEACDMVKYVDVNDENALAKMHSTVQECLNEVERWRLRSDLQDDAKMLINNSLTNAWINSGTHKAWSSGKLGVSDDPKYSATRTDVTHRREKVRKEWKAQSQYQTCHIGGAQDAIIGFHITNEWNNNDNGWFKWHHGRVCEDSSVKVEFCSMTWRGCDWTLDVWTVPKSVYEVDQTKY